MDAKTEQMLRELQTAGSIRPEDLALKLGVSVRTVRTYVKRANALLQPHMAIELKRGKGYHLVKTDESDESSSLPKLFNQFEHKQGIPTSREQRITYLIDDLLSRDDWITIDKLSEILFISRRTISENLKEVEEILAPFGLVLERRPRYGVRVTGSEMGRRLCLAHRAMKNLPGADALLDLDDDGVEIDAIAECVEQGLQAYDLHVRTASYQNLLVHIAVAVERIKHGMYVPLPGDQLNEIAGTLDYAAAQSIARLVEERFSIELPQEEVAYIAIHLAGKQILTGPEVDGAGIEISDDVWDVVSQMLEAVQSTFRFDFSEDIELRMNLARHIVPLTTRLQYHMELKNPLLDDIRSRFPLAFAMAREASVVLESTYEAQLSDDEVAYIAFAFALALERQKSERPKKNIVIVCASGAGSARLLECRYRDEFGAYLGNITTCDVREVASLDFSHIDYVFTTVPLGVELPVPVRRVGFFLDERDIHAVKRLFQHTNDFDLTAFIPEQLFMPHQTFASRAEAIDRLSGALGAADTLPQNFTNLVWERENSMSTEFGNQVAIPHPIEPVGTKTLVAVALLDEPITWDAQSVRVVLLISVARENHGDINGLYERISRLLVSKEAIDALLEDQTYSHLIGYMEEGE